MDMEIRIILSEKGCFVEELLSEDVYGRRRQVDIEDLAEIFQVLREEGQKLDDSIVFKYPLFPNVKEGVIGTAIHKNGTVTYLWFCKPGIRPFIFYDETFYVGYPGLLFIFGVQNTKVVGSRLLAVKDEEITLDTELFYYPFSNVYRNHSICWGNYSLPSVERVEDIGVLVRQFFSLPNNQDLYNDNNLSNLPLRELLQELSDKPFNMAYLRPINKVYEDLFN